MFADLCKKLGFPSESLPILESAYLSVCELPCFQKARESLLSPNTAAFNETTKKIIKTSGINTYTLNIVLCISCLDELRKIYERQGKREKFESYAKALKKLLEACKDTYGVWGLENALWNWIFHDHQCIKLGRLEFEPYFHFCDVEYKGIKKGDSVILIHIPGGTPLDMGEVEKSLKLGYEHFKDRFENETVPFITHSWLIYPPYFDCVFKKGGNLEKFARLFNVIDENDENFANFATVFGRAYRNEDLDSVPKETSLQRNMLKFIKDGNPMGQGYGIFFYGKNGIWK